MKVAVVLGNRMADDGSLSDIMVLRLKLALEYIKKENPDKVILSGGVANKKAGISEADKIMDYLVNEGVSINLLIKEDKSLTTKENAKFSVPIARSLGADTIVIITSAEHIARKYLNPVKLFKRFLGKDNIKLTFFTNK